MLDQKSRLDPAHLGDGCTSWKIGTIVGSVLDGGGRAILGGFFGAYAALILPTVPAVVEAVGGGLGGLVAGGLIGALVGTASPSGTVDGSYASLSRAGRKPG